MNHSICPSCGTEFGYEDVTTTHEALRAKWLRNGGPWFDDSMPPPAGWDPWRQVMEAFYRPTFGTLGKLTIALVRFENAPAISWDMKPIAA